MQGHKKWFSMRIHIACNYSMLQAMGSCKIEQYIRRLHQNLATLPELTAPRRLSKHPGRGWLLFKRRLLVLLRSSSTTCGSNHRCRKISSSFDTGGGDWQILGDWYSRRDERTRTCKRNREKITTIHMSDNRVRRIASGNSRWLESSELSISISKWWYLEAIKIPFVHMTWISFINTHSELVWLNVEDQVHLARMASVAKG